MQKLKKYITKNLIIKILWYIGLSIIFSSWGIFVWVWNDTVNTNVNIVLAQETTQETTEDKMWEMIEKTNIFLKGMYVLIWPFLFIAGIAVDNSIVYGSFLNMDAPLFTIWNILKNFANFTLWFLVLFNILKMVFGISDSAKSQSDVKKVITNTLMAWVLIQASWFLVAAVIDISTIATYAIGSMPTASFSSSEFINKPVLKNTSIYDTTKLAEESVKGKELYTYYSYWDKKLSPCKVERIENDFYIIGNEYSSLKNNTIVFETGHCVYFNEVYMFNPTVQPTILWTGYSSALTNVWNTAKDEKLVSDYVNDWTVLQLNWKIATWYGLLYSWNTMYDDFYKTSTGGYIGMTIDKLMQESKWYVGPFVTIYASLLNFSDLTSDSNLTDNNVYENFFIFIIKIAFSLAMLAPLIALAAVLIIRVWYLRLIIAFSPWIVLISVFDMESKLKLPESFKKYVNIWEIVKVIFAPVIIVFAMNISILFLSAIQSSFTEGSSTEWNLLEEMHIEKKDKTYSFLWLVEIEYSGDNLDNGKDIFSYVITMMMGLGVMRFILFAAIKANAIGATVWKFVQDTAQWAMGQLPIIPMPWWWSVGTSWLRDIKTAFAQKFAPGSIPTNQQNAINSAFSFLDKGKNKDKDQDIDTTKIEGKYRNDMWASLSWWASVQEVLEKNKNLLANAHVDSEGELIEAIKQEKAYKSNANQQIPSSTSKQSIDGKEVSWYDLVSYNKSSLDNGLYFDAKWQEFWNDNIWSLVKSKDWEIHVITRDNNGNIKLEKEETYEANNFEWEIIGTEISENIQKDRLNKIDNSITELKAEKDKAKDQEDKKKIDQEISDLKKHRDYYKTKTDVLIKKQTPQS